MKRVASIGSLLKKLYRLYSGRLLETLGQKGFTDLRPSFLEVLIFICEHQAPSIKQIGLGCGLKKQTMTSHLNELEKRGYIKRVTNSSDKREQLIHLTEYGEKFKLNLMEAIIDLEKDYVKIIGALELERIEGQLKTFLEKLQSEMSLDHLKE